MALNKKLNKALLSGSFMASHSLSSLLHPHHYRPNLFSSSNPNPNLALSHNPSLRTATPRRTLTFFSSSNPNPSSDQSSPPESKKSFAVATGELFIGLAAQLIRNSSARAPIGDGVVGETSGNDAAVIWEQGEKDVEAELRRRVVTSPGFSFSAAGLLFPYHLGVARYLIEYGYIKDTTPLAGSSAGAIVCAVIASGASMEEALRATKILADDCRSKGTAFRLGAVLRNVLDNFLPDDVHIRSNGRVRVAVTRLLWRPRGILVDNFDSKEDVINAVVTSSFIPGYLAPRPVTLFRNRLCIDGGLTLFMPPTSASKTVCVCAFPASRLGLEGIGISPDCNPENRASPRELFNWALEPAQDSILDRLFELGYKDAEVWAKDNPVSELVGDESPLVGTGLAT